MEIIEIGAENQKPVPKKPIQLCVALNNEFEFDTKNSVSQAETRYYNRIELICRDYSDYNAENFDLIFCLLDGKDRSKGVLYLGHWNDGVV